MKLFKSILLLSCLFLIVGCNNKEKKPTEEVIKTVNMKELKNNKEDVEKIVSAINYQLKDEKMELEYSYDKEHGEGQRHSYVYKLKGDEKTLISFMFYVEENYLSAINIDSSADSAKEHFNPFRDAVLKALNLYDKCSNNEKCKITIADINTIKKTTSENASIDKYLFGLSVYDYEDNPDIETTYNYVIVNQIK